MIATPPATANMSLTSRERRNPPPRQKSCAACIRAKRRCEPGGGASPVCIRCEQRGLSCELPSRRGRRAAATAVPTPSPSMPYTDFMSSSVDTSLPVEGCADFDGDLFSVNSAFPAWDNNISNLTLETEPTPPDSTFSFAEFTEPPAMPLIHQPAMPVAEATRKDWEPLSELARRRLQYPIDQIKKVPAMFVLEGQTPWCHPRLYEEETPKCVQEALSCCALSMQLNPLNTPLILRTITSHIKTLLSTPQPTSPLHILAHTQSLLLYHIILIFSQDVHTRSMADTTQSALEDLAMSLLTHVNFDIAAQHPSEELSLYPMAPTMAFWKDWVFHESGRRTLLFTFFLLQAYRILAGKPIDACDGRLGMCHSFTLSAQLWHAPSAVEFAKAWKETKHLIVTNGQLDVAFKDARAKNVDTFGRILITSIMGVDEAEGWFASRGGSLFTKDDGFV